MQARRARHAALLTIYLVSPTSQLHAAAQRACRCIPACPGLGQPSCWSLGFVPGQPDELTAAFCAWLAQVMMR